MALDPFVYKSFQIALKCRTGCDPGHGQHLLESVPQQVGADSEFAAIELDDIHVEEPSAEAASRRGVTYQTIPRLCEVLLSTVDFILIQPIHEVASLLVEH